MAAPPEQSIFCMDAVLASQVAAGEVVERPASVVKELVENSIDAGAKSVRVEIRRGGVSLVKVSDDGCGMSRTDAAMCMLRHATSKLRSVEGLFDIRHLGFRGEALPSIASVSHLRLTTRRAADIEGTLISCDGGSMAEPMNAGCAPGTVIEASELFFNTPVRRKFLKSDETEAGHVEHQLKLHALAFPRVRFTYVRDGQIIFDCPATDDLRRRIADFIGRDAAERLMCVRPTESPGMKVSGFLMPLSDARRNRRMQYFFLNGRPIDDKIVARAVRDGYGGFPTGLHPALFLYLDVEPALVDVNVHPSKREVRFRRPGEVTTAVLDAVAGTLASYARGEGVKEKQSNSSAECAPSVEAVAPVRYTTPPNLPSPEPRKRELIASPAPPVPFELRPVLQPTQQELFSPGAAAKASEKEVAFASVDESREAAPPSESSSPLLCFRHVGTMKDAYAIFENSEGLVLLSPKAARERIIYDRLQASQKRALPSQRLLSPAMVEIDARDMGSVREVLSQLEKVGFLVSVFGQRTLRLEAVPSTLPLREAEPFMLDLLRVFSRGDVRLSRARDPFSLFSAQLARLYARQEDIGPFLAAPMPLLEELLRCDIPYCTPGGKPTLVPIPFSEMKRKFQAQ